MVKICKTYGIKTSTKFPTESHRSSLIIDLLLLYIHSRTQLFFVALFNAKYPTGQFLTFKATLLLVFVKNFISNASGG